VTTLSVKNPLVWEATRRELLADLRTFLDRDTERFVRSRIEPMEEESESTFTRAAEPDEKYE